MNPLVPRASFSGLLRLTAEYFKLPEEDLIGPSRRRKICLARQVVAYLTRQHCGWSYAQIGEHLGNRTHATILHACRVLGRQLDESSDLRMAVGAISEVATKESRPGGGGAYRTVFLVLRIPIDQFPDFHPESMKKILVDRLRDTAKEFGTTIEEATP